MKTLMLAVGAAFLATGIQTGSAAVLANYAIDSVATSFASSGEIPGSVALNANTSIATGSMTDEGDHISALGSEFRRTQGTPAPLTGASDRHFLWAIYGADPGTEVALDSIEWRVGATSTNSFSSRIYTTIYVATDLGFTNIIATSDVEEVGVGSAGTAFADFTFAPELGGNTYEALFFGMGVTTFADTSNGTKTLQFESIKVNGSIVPEPSLAALLGIGSLGLLRRRIRRRVAGH